MNANIENVYLFKNNKLKIIQNYEKKVCYLTNAENDFLIFDSGNHKPAKKNWFQSIMKTGVVTLTVYQAVVNF